MNETLKNLFDTYESKIISVRKQMAQSKNDVDKARFSGQETMLKEILSDLKGIVGDLKKPAKEEKPKPEKKQKKATKKKK